MGELSLFHMMSTGPGTSKLASSLTCRATQQAWLQQLDWGSPADTCFSLSAGFFILILAIPERLPPCSFSMWTLHLASPVVIPARSSDFLHALLRVQKWNHQAMFYVSLRPVQFKRKVLNNNECQEEWSSGSDQSHSLPQLS